MPHRRSSFPRGAEQTPRRGPSARDCPSSILDAYFSFSLPQEKKAKRFSVTTTFSQAHVLGSTTSQPCLSESFTPTRYVYYPGATNLTNAQFALIVSRATEKPEVDCDPRGCKGQRHSPRGCQRRPGEEHSCRLHQHQQAGQGPYLCWR